MKYYIIEHTMLEDYPVYDSTSRRKCIDELARRREMHPERIYYLVSK